MGSKSIGRNLIERGLAAAVCAVVIVQYAFAGTPGSPPTSRSASNSASKSTSMSASNSASKSTSTSATSSAGEHIAIAAPAQKRLQGGVTKTDLGVDLEHKFGITAIKSGGNAKAEVIDVRLGGGGYYAGVKPGDRIVDAKSNKDDVDLVIDRDGKKYSVKLTPNPMRLGDETAVKPEPKPDPKFALELNKPEVQRQMISKRDVVVIIDRTGSMEIKDCPNNQSRWDWCRAQTVGLMKDLLGKVNEITVVTFNENFQVYPQATLNKVDSIYQTVKPEGATNTAAPLRNRLDDYLHRKRVAGKTPMKPLLVAVITDGLPNWPEGQQGAEQAVRDVIVKATREMTTPDEITVTFLGVGNAMEGDAFLRELDEDIVNEGAVYDIVDTKPFSELQTIGLKRALVDALVESKTTKASNLPERQDQGTLAGLMKRKMKLERAMGTSANSGVQNLAPAGAKPKANAPANAFANPEKAANKMELQSVNRNIDVLKRAEQERKDIDARLNDDINRLQSQANDRMSPFSQNAYGRMGRGARSEIMQIQQDTQSRIARLIAEANQKKKAIQANAEARLESENSLRDGMKTQLRSKGSMMIVPTGSNLYVRNYANFGKDVDEDQDRTIVPIRAKAGQYQGTRKSKK